jgi:hypothetical protein
MKYERGYMQCALKFYGRNVIIFNSVIYECHLKE